MTSLAMAKQRIFAFVLGSVACHLSAVLGRSRLPARDEIAGLRPLSRFLIIGLMAWIILVCLVTAVALVAVEFSVMDFPSFAVRASSSPAIGEKPQSAFENIVQRPLFSRSRQVASPPQVHTPDPLPQALLDRALVLKGVFINGHLAKAFLTSSQNPAGTWVRATDEIEGWRVVAVTPNQVVLEGQNEKWAISLNNSVQR
jgi:hypothetical protein